MDNKISVLIQSILEAPTQENINKVKSQIQSAIGKVTSKSGSNGVKLLNQEEIDIYIKKLQNELQRIQFRTPKVFDNEAVKKELNKLNIEFDKLRNGETTTKKVSLQMDNLKTQIVGASSALKNVNKDGYSFAQMIELASKKIAIWGLSTTFVYGAWRQIKEGISYISELDNSLNEIRIVTNKTQQEVNNLALSYNKLAKEMNVTTKEVASTAADLFRQGLNDSQVEERMKAIIQYAKISSISLEESNKIITATANATGESVRKIVDIFAYLGDATASGAEEIGEALQKVASTAENSGVSLEKAASWIATISSITRESASSIGNSLKTIISRYEQIKAKGFNEEDATQINDVTKALQAVGITAVDAQGQLRPIAEVLDELGAKWNSLTKNEQAYVATTLAGTYQRNRLITLLDNYNDSLKNYEAALNSAGIAEEKFAIYQDSVQAKLDKLSATWEEFWQKSLNSELIKGTIQALTTLIDTFGNLRTVLSLIATGIALWKGTEILNFFKSLPLSIKNSYNEMLRYQTALYKASLVQKGLTAAEIEAQVATKGLSLAFVSLGQSIKTAFLSNPLGWIAVGLTTIISLVDIFNQKQEEMRQKIEESAQKAKEQSNSIAELMGRYNQVIDLVGEDKNARDQLQSIQSELVKTLGLEKEAIDLVNDSREESIKKIREEAIEKLKANENALIAAKNLAEQEKKNKKGSRSFLGISVYEYVGSPILSDKEKKAFNLMKTISGLRVDRFALGTFISIADYMATAEERAEILETALQALKDAGLENTNVFNQLARSQQEYNDVINKAKEATDAHNKNIAQQLILQKENEIGIPKTVQEFENFRKTILDNSSGTEDFKRALDELLSQEYPQFAKQTKDNSNSTFDLSKSYENLLKSISKTSDDLKTLNRVLDDVQNGQSLNAETVLDLIQKYPELTDAIHKTADGWTIEKDAIENLRKAKIEEARTTIENQINATKTTLDSVSARVNAYGIEIAAIEDLKSAQQEASKLGFKKVFGENAFENIKFDDSTNRITVGDKITEWSKEEYDKIKQSFNEQKLANDTILKIGELKERSKKLLELLSDPNFGVSSSKSTPFSEQFDFINIKIKSLNQELKELQQQLDDTFSPADKQTIIDKMIVAQQKKADLLKKAIKTYEDSAQKELQKIPKSLRSAVVSGSFNITTISEKTYGEKRAKEISEAIKQYQSLTDTIIGLKNEYAEIDNTIRSLDLDKITLSFEVFDKKIRESDRTLEELDYQLNLLKDNDYDKKAEILTKKIEVTTKQVNEYKQELKRLKAIVPANEEVAEKLQERIDELTKKFREGKISIKEYNDALEETAKNLISTFKKTVELFGRAIRDIKDDLEYIDEDSPEYFAKLNEASTVAANQANYLQGQIEKLHAEYKAGNINLEQYQEMLEYLYDALYDVNDVSKDIAKTMASALSENQKRVLDDLADSYKKLTDSINANYEAYEKVNRAKKEALRLERENEKYLEEVKELTDEINKIQNKMTELQPAIDSGDRKAEAEYKKLLEELDKKQKDLKEKQRDRERDLQEDALDKALDDAKEVRDKQLEHAKTVYETKMDQLKKLYAEEKKLIESMTRYASDQFNSLLSSLETRIANIIGDINSLTGINVSGIGSDFINKTKETQSNLPKPNTTVGSSGLTQAERERIYYILTHGEGKDYGKGASRLAAYTRDVYGKPISKPQMLEIAKILKVSGINSVDDITANDVNKDRILQALQLAGFNRGGLVKATGEDGIALVKRNELIVNQAGTKVFTSELAPLMKNFVHDFNLFKNKLPDFSNITTTKNFSPTVPVNITIQGNADANTVNALNKASINIANEVAKAIMNIKRVS